ncbi:MAG: diphthamide biosynthesis enzyme Dph2 [Thermoproteota archaeon]|nr:diphthamide biosynthesis enzyme Dph2 [Thermoproteota archaeon]
MIRIDEETIFSIIATRKPHSVALSGPEALMHKIQDSAEKITELCRIPAYIIGDTSWGSCDLNTHAAEVVGADILFNIGHTISLNSFGDKVVMIDAYDDINFENVATKCAIELKDQNIRNISLVTNSQHLGAIERVKEIFEEHGYHVIIGRGKGHLNDAQVFGCEFYPAYDVQNNVDAYIFLGQSVFHAAGIAIATQKTTFMLDPYFEEYSDVNDIANKLQKKAILSVYKSLDAKSIGIIIGLKEGQFSQLKALEIKKAFENLGKTVQLIVMTEITEERIRIFSGIDVFVQVACPRISTDNHFDKPMLSVPQAVSLIKLLKKEPVENFMQISHWL